MTQIRQDVEIDGKQVKCPNVSHLGFDKWVAQVGDLLLVKGYWSGSDELLAARMIGRVAFDPDGKCNGFIVCVCISPELSHTFERWIKPADVMRIQPVDNEDLRRQAVAEWFLSDEMTKRAKADVSDLLRCVAGGWSSYSRFAEWKKGIERRIR